MWSQDLSVSWMVSCMEPPTPKENGNQALGARLRVPESTMFHWLKGSLLWVDDSLPGPVSVSFDMRGVPLINNLLCPV